MNVIETTDVRHVPIYVQRYLDRWQIRNIEIRSRRNPFHRQRQRNISEQ